MYKVLIVDDESWTRERLRSRINWESLGISVIEEAEDGEDALKISETVKPEIIITDIRMPIIGGIEFIKQLRDKSCESKVIIISGYSDFEYAKEVIKLNVFDYILKPIENEELTSAIRRCTKELDSEKEIIDLNSNRDLKLNKSLPIMREKIFFNMIDGIYDNENELMQELEQLDLMFVGARSLCFIVQVEELENNEEYENGLNKKQINSVIQNTIGNFSKKIGNYICFSGYKGEVIALIATDSNEDILHQGIISCSKEISRIVKNNFKPAVTIGIGSCQTNILNISQSYEDAKQAMQYRNFLGRDKIYESNDLDMSDIKPNYKVFKELDIFLNNLKACNRIRTFNNLDSMIASIYKYNPTIYPINLKLLFIDIVNSIFKSILNDKNLKFDFSEYGMKFLEQLNKLQTIDEISKWLHDTVESLIDLLILQKGTRKRKSIEHALEYIDGHFGEPLTLGLVSEKIFLNASYFCKIFSENTGETFTKYLMKIRIRKAKLLMYNPSLKIYEISSMVGYEDAKYFTRIFKKLEGVTPLEYREKIK